MTLGRRRFLALGGSLLALSLAPPRAFGASKGSGPAPAPKKKVLVVVFQRGAVDGLSMVPPIADPRYFDLRSSIALGKPGSGDGAALPLDATFGLHPSLAPLTKLWDERRLAIVHAVGSPDATRSHFDAQDYVESGTPGTKTTDDGWLNRVLAAEPAAPSTALRAVALQPMMPRILTGDAPALAMDSLGALRVAGPGGIARDFEHMYAGAVDRALRGTAAEAFDAMRTVKAVQRLPPRATAKYPSSQLGRRMQQIADLVWADVGLEIAVTDCGGWDTHANQGNARGQLAQRLDDLGRALATFASDLGPHLADVCAVTVTEFGRTARENGTKGTDHGHGSVMLVFGGVVKGKRVYAKWRGLADGALWQGRDLAVTTDHRDVFAELVRGHLGSTSLDRVFPGHAPAKVGLLG